MILIESNACMQGGGVVRLFHREKECYVSAEGSFAENQAVIEDGKLKIINNCPRLLI